MSLIDDIDAPEWIKENHPENGLFKVYWKDVINTYTGSVTLDPEEGEELRYEWYYKDGKQDGISKGWYPNGQMKSEWNYKNGIKDGLWKCWWPNGNKNGEWTYKNGQLVYEDISWHLNGQRESLGVYIEGRRVVYKSWNSSGKEQ